MNCSSLQFQLFTAASGSRSDFESVLNQITWSTDAVNSFESSVNNGPLADICVPHNELVRRSTLISIA